MDKNLRSNILERIKPSKDEQELIDKTVKKFVRKLRKASRTKCYKCEFFIGGSYGKDTYLRGNFDVDIFCRFDIKLYGSNLSEMVELMLIEAKLAYKKQKGSRDYFSVAFGPKKMKMLFEVIPTLKIKNVDEMVNSTDVSPFHVNFLKEQIKKDPKITDEIRLAKQYFKSQGLYGAESYINGFSGHVIDILIAKYKTLEKLLIDAKTWEERKCIDINNFYESENDILTTLDEDKLSNLIVIDPIIKDRNASRALNNEKYCEFILLANEFVGFEEKDFEIIKPDSKDIIEYVKTFSKDNNLRYLIYKFNFKISGESEDIVGSKLLKLHGKVKKYFQSYDFKIFNEDFFINIDKGECLFIYIFEKVSLPNIKKIIGPKVYMKDAVRNFLKGKERYFIEDSRVCVYEKRIVEHFYDASEISLDKFQQLLGRDISFIKNVRIFKKY